MRDYGLYQAGLVTTTIETGRRVSTRRAPTGWILAIGLALALPVHAWWGDSHSILTEAAVLALPQEVPEFFRSGGDMVAHVSYDADLAKNRGAPHLNNAEHPEHYLDLEYLGDHELPALRHEFVSLCDSLGLEPAEVGFLAYAVAESTERLAVAFAEHRKWPADEVIHAKCLVYAGHLAHYAQDLVQPLHVTVDHHGRTAADGTKIGGQIHEHVDSIIERLALAPGQLAGAAPVAPLGDDLFAAVRDQLSESHGHVERVYELVDDLDPATDAGRTFAVERAQRAVGFTASLYLTAWRMSADIRLPGWLER